MILIEINDEENVALADIQHAIKQLNRFHKQTASRSNGCAAAVVHQATIRSLLEELGKEGSDIAVGETYGAAGGYPFMHLC